MRVMRRMDCISILIYDSILITRRTTWHEYIWEKQFTIITKARNTTFSEKVIMRIALFLPDGEVGGKLLLKYNKD